MNKPIKKTHILFTIPNFDTAGSGRVVYDLAKGLDKRFFCISIACRNDKGAFFKTVETLGVNIYLREFSIPLKPYYSLIQRTSDFRQFLKNEEVDIVHSWNWSGDWTEPLSCRLVNIPFVYTKKSMGWGTKHWKLKSWMSNFIITVNPQMRSFFPRKKNQRLIPFGLDTNYYCKRKVTTLSENFRIITVANILPVKGIDVLIRAIEKLKELNISLDIIGSGHNSYAESIQLLVRDLNIESKVRFLGSTSDVRPYLEDSSLFILPSRQEGMPMALVEAMSMGLPVLGSNIAGIQFVLKEFEQLIFKINDVNDLADKIRDLYLKPSEELIRLGLSLREYCINHFNMNMFLRAHETVYKEMLND